MENYANVFPVHIWLKGDFDHRLLRCLSTNQRICCPEPKHHNTIKVLIGITPQGTVSFVSDPWGGRTSEKFLTENCGILDKLLPEDTVITDRGFTISESVRVRHGKLVIPAITKARKESNGCSWCGAITGNCECEDSCRKSYRPSETQVYFIRRHTINKVLKLWSQWALRVSGTHHWSHFEGLLSP